MIDSDAEVSDSEEDPQGLLQRWMFGEVGSAASSLLMCQATITFFSFRLLPLFYYLYAAERNLPNYNLKPM
jgi:hypothetical protein